tara:strand:+ start:544 stop:648 length:105 start_codon:yes stop_codon:yes gene_type:complete
MPMSPDSDLLFYKKNGFLVKKKFLFQEIYQRFFA